MHSGALFAIFQYEEDSDTYFVTTVEDGVEVDHEVTLGPTDGVVRVVTSELPGCVRPYVEK